MNTKPISTLIFLLLTLNVSSQRFGNSFNWNYNSSFQQSNQDDLEDDLELEKAEQELEETLKLAKSLGIETDDIEADTPDSVIDNFSDDSQDDSQDDSLDDSSGFSSDNYSDFSPYSYSSKQSPSRQQSNSNIRSFNSWNFSKPISSTNVWRSEVSTDYKTYLPSQPLTFSTSSFKASNLNCQHSFGSGLTGFGQESDYIYFDSKSGTWRPCPTTHIPRQFNSYSNFY